MKKIYNKLVRDKIIDEIKAKGLKHSYDTLTTEEYKKALIHKLQEEVDELKDALENNGELQNEICDILTVIDYIVIAYNIDLEELHKYSLYKMDEKGGFGEKIFLKWVEDE